MTPQELLELNARLDRRAADYLKRGDYFALGYTDHQSRGKAWADNPFAEGTEEAAAWGRGWTRSEKEN